MMTRWPTRPRSTSTSFEAHPAQPTTRSGHSPTSCRRTTPGISTLPISGRGEPFFFYLDPHVHEEFVEIAPGAAAWRSIVREEAGAAQIPGFAIVYEDADLRTESIAPMNYLARRNTTAQWRDRFGLFSYWNHGPPDQPSDEAIESARRDLRYGDDHGAAWAIPLEVLERGSSTSEPPCTPVASPASRMRRSGSRMDSRSADADRETE